MKRSKNSKNDSLPDCQTISVVMSPKGVNAPPAFAATTMLMQPSATKRALSRPIASSTAPMTSDVVRLSSRPDIRKDRMPVIQNSLR